MNEQQYYICYATGHIGEFVFQSIRRLKYVVPSGCLAIYTSGSPLYLDKNWRVT